MNAALKFNLRGCYKSATLEVVSLALIYTTRDGKAMRGHGATVARPTPDRKAGCLSHSGLMMLALHVCVCVLLTFPGLKAKEEYEI